MKQQFEQHKRKDRIKWIATAIALFLLATSVVGMGLQLFGSGKEKPSEWFAKDEKQTEQLENNQIGDNDIAAISSYSTSMTALTSSDEVATQSETLLYQAQIIDYPNDVKFDDAVTALQSFGNVSDVTSLWSLYIRVNDFVRREEFKNRIHVYYINGSTELW